MYINDFEKKLKMKFQMLSILIYNKGQSKEIAILVEKSKISQSELSFLSNRRCTLKVKVFNRPVYLS